MIEFEMHIFYRNICNSPKINQNEVFKLGLFDKFVTPKHLRQRYEIDNSISDDKLFEIAQKHNSGSMRRDATEKIRNKNQLTELSKSGDLDTCWGVLDNYRADDQMLMNVLKYAAANNDAMLSGRCVEKIRSEAIINEIAGNQNIANYIRIPAVEKVTNKRLLKRISSETERDSLTLLSKESFLAKSAAKRLEELGGYDENKSIDDILDECVDDLVMIYTNNPDGFLSASPDAKPVRDIGETLNDAGGMDLMLRAHEIFSARITGVGLARNLEMVWDGIGNWRG